MPDRPAIKYQERIAKGSRRWRDIPMPFDPKNPDPGVIDNFLGAVSDKANQPIYIHCGSATRVAALWMVGRVLKDGWAIDAAELIALKPDDAIAFATAYIADLGN